MECITKGLEDLLATMKDVSAPKNAGTMAPNTIEKVERCAVVLNDLWTEQLLVRPGHWVLHARVDAARKPAQRTPCAEPALLRMTLLPCFPRGVARCWAQ